MADLARLETPRLVLTRVVRDDVEFLASMWQDPAVTAMLGGPRGPAAVAAVAERWVAHWSDHGFGPWILRTRDDEKPVGWVGLSRTDVGGPGGTELLYALGPSHQGRGLVTEAGGHLLEVAFGELALESVVAFTLPGNTASRAVMERLGFAYEGPVEHAGLPHVLYRKCRVEPVKG